MNKIRAFFYILKQSFENLFKNWYMLLASILVLFTGLYIMGCLLLVSANISKILSEQAEHPEVEVICRQTVTDEDSLSVYRVILIDDRVQSVQRYTKAENFEKLKDKLAGFEDLFQYDDATSDYLYVSFNVVLKSAESLEGFSSDMRKVSGVETVQDNDSIYKYFRSINNIVITGTGVAMVLMGVLSILLTVSTIALTVVARKKELRIMRDIGASYSFMRGPFFVEGIVIGLVGALAAFFAVKITYSYVSGVLRESSGSLRSILTLAPFSDYSGKLLWGFIAGGLAVGLIASMLSIRKLIDNEKDDDK